MKDTFTLLFDDNTSIDLFDNDYFQTTEISGLTYYKANLNKRTLATIPGDTVTDVHVEPRELTIYFQPKSNNSFSVENAVRYILDHARKGFCIYFLWDKKQSDGTVLNLKARAKIEYIDLPRFENPVDGEIGLHMEYPFFVSETGKSYTLNEYNEFERVITNDGDAAIGVSIDVKFAGDINDLVLENVTTGEKIKLEELNALSNDHIDINTRTGEKSVIQRSTGDSIIDTLDVSSAWITLVPGDNLMTATYDDSNSSGGLISVRIVYNEVYI